VPQTSVDELTELFVHDIAEGIGDTGVRAGIIGEIGTSGVRKGAAKTAKDGHATPEEEKVLRAAGRAAVATGVAVTMHMDRRGKGAFHVIDILEGEGLAPDRIIIGHMDTVFDVDYHRSVAERGVYVQYDTWGREYYNDVTGVAWRSDVRRCEFLAAMLEAGYEDRMLLAHDVTLKMDLRRYGGNGYDHLPRVGLPMMKRHGVTNEQIEKMTVLNPARALAVAA
jgi:phosphotriesterase-related protein